MKKFVNESWLVLTMGIVFALLLAFTQRALSDRISENQRRELNKAINEVVPGTATAEPLTIDGYDVFKCIGADGAAAGWAVKGTGTGFVDKITLVLGLSADGGRITGLRVIENLETPGLGNKIAESGFSGQYGEMDATKEITVVKGGADKNRGQIDAITGATWSSRYTTDIVNRILQDVRPRLAEHR